MIKIIIEGDKDFEDDYEMGCGRDSLLSQLNAAQNWLANVEDDLCRRLDSQYLKGAHITIEDHKHTPKNQSS